MKPVVRVTEDNHATRVMVSVNGAEVWVRATAGRDRILHTLRAALARDPAPAPALDDVIAAAQRWVIARDAYLDRSVHDDFDEAVELDKAENALRAALKADPAPALDNVDVRLAMLVHVCQDVVRDAGTAKWPVNLDRLRMALDELGELPEEEEQS